MATAVPMPVPVSTPPSPDTLHTPISNESAEITLQQQQLRQDHTGQTQTYTQDPPLQPKRMSTTSVSVDVGAGTGVGVAGPGTGQKRKSRTSIGAVSVVKIEQVVPPPPSSSGRRQSVSHPSSSKRSKSMSTSRSRSRSYSPRRLSGGSGIGAGKGSIELEMDTAGHHGHHHRTRRMTFELEDGRRVSVSSVTGVGSARGNGSQGTGGAVTPKDRLPPSPPLTRVGSDDSIRASGRRSRKTSKRKSVDAKSAGGTNNEASTDVPTDGDISLQNITTHQPGDENLEDAGHGARTKDEGGDGVAVQPAEAATEEEGSRSRPTGAGEPAAVRASSSSSRPSSPAATSLNQPPGDSAPRALDHPMYTNYDVVGATSSAPRPLPLRSRASEAKLTGRLSPLPSPTRNHPLYRPPSPQPWDLVQPPLENNAGMNGAVSGYANANTNGTGRSRKTGASGTLEGVEGSVKSDVILVEKDVVVKDGKRYRIPRSSYYFGPPPATSAYGTEPVGQIGVHHPREIVRVERDYSGGELCQFSPAYPLELEGRITPTQFIETINTINESLISAHSIRWSCLDNTLAVFTLYLSRLFIRSHYERELERLKKRIDELNKTVYNPVGLNILWPKNVAFMFLEIEYY